MSVDEMKRRVVERIDADPLLQVEYFEVVNADTLEGDRPVERHVPDARLHRRPGRQRAADRQYRDLVTGWYINAYNNTQTTVA